MTKAYFKMRVLSVFLPLACYLKFSQGLKSTCMAPPVRLGDEATLSCHFEEDVSKIQHDVLVYLYKDNKEYPVVIYSWHDGQENVHTMEGYRCEGKITEYLVIKVMNVSNSNAGHYGCLVAFSKEKPTTCTLKIIETSQVSSGIADVKDPLLQESMTSFRVTENHAFQDRNIIVEHREADDNKLHTAVIVLGVLLGVLLFAFLAILLCAIYKRWIPKHCCTERHGTLLSHNQDIANNNDTGKGNSINISKLTLTYKKDIKSDEEQLEVLTV